MLNLCDINNSHSFSKKLNLNVDFLIEVVIFLSFSDIKKLISDVSDVYPL
jgi:hypothetical protein